MKLTQRERNLNKNCNLLGFEWWKTLGGFEIGVYTEFNSILTTKHEAIVLVGWFEIIMKIIRRRNVNTYVRSNETIST